MPAIIARSISILSDAGLGMAMFSLGMFLSSWAILYITTKLRQHKESLKYIILMVGFHLEIIVYNKIVDFGFAGLFMALQPRIIACGKSIATFSMAVRFLTGPAVMAAASIAVGLRGVLLHVAIVQVKELYCESTKLFSPSLPNYSFGHCSATKFHKFVFIFSGCSSTRDCALCLCQGIQCSS